MSVTLLVVAVWCVVSVLFAAAHARWAHYASPAGPAGARPQLAGRAPARLVEGRRAAQALGRAELARTLARYARN
jgi:hypothetical protein